FDIYKVAKEKSLSIEVCARECRYHYFNQIASKYSGKIATAHTLSDSMETVFFNLIRGSGMTGICGIPPRRENIIRPLIECTRKEIEEYCNKHNQDYVMDSSNLTDEYTRNKIRHHMIPYAYKINPRFDGAFLNFTQTIKEDQRYLMNKAYEAFDSVVKQEKCDIKQLLLLDLAIRSRVLTLFLAKYCDKIDKKKMDLIYSMLLKKSGSIQLSKNIYLKINCEFLEIQYSNPIKATPYFQVILANVKEQTIILNHKKLVIEEINNNINNFVKKNAFYSQLIC
ncbi:MAG: tRNA lysidine(34) synthetase TilS, partial [Oscillospiraceae bacterium]